MCVCACVYTLMYVYVYTYVVCMCRCVCARVSMRVRLRACMCIYLHLSTSQQVMNRTFNLASILITHSRELLLTHSRRLYPSPPRLHYPHHPPRTAHGYMNDRHPPGPDTSPNSGTDSDRICSRHRGDESCQDTLKATAALVVVVAGE